MAGITDTMLESIKRQIAHNISYQDGMNAGLTLALGIIESEIQELNEDEDESTEDE